MSHRGEKLRKISKIPKSHYIETTTERREYVSVNNPSNTKNEFSYGKSSNPINIEKVRKIHEVYEERGHPASRVHRRQPIRASLAPKIDRKRSISKTNREIIKSQNARDTKRPLEGRQETNSVNFLIDKIMQMLSRVKSSKIPEKERMHKVVTLLRDLENDIQQMHTSNLDAGPRASMQKVVEAIANVSQDLQNESMPEYSSFSDKGAIPKRSFLTSREMETDNLFKNPDPSMQEVVDLEENLSDIDDESLPEMNITDPKQIYGREKSKHSLKNLSDLANESFPGYKSSIEPSEQAKSFLESGEMNTENLFGEATSEDYFKSAKRRIPVEFSERFSAIADESSPDLVSSFKTPGKSGQFTSASDLEKESFPNVSELPSSHYSGRSILESHEMNTEDLFKVDQTPSKSHHVSRSYNLSEIDKESRPHYTSLGPEDYSRRSILKSHEMNTEDLFKVDKTPSKSQQHVSKSYKNLSEIDKETRPDYTSLGPEEASGTHSKRQETMPNYSRFEWSLAKNDRLSGRSSDVRDQSSILKSHEMSPFGSLTERSRTSSRLKHQDLIKELDEKLSQIADVSPPSFKSTRRKSIFDKSTVQDLFPKLISRDSSKNRHDRSFLTSKEMDTDGFLDEDFDEQPSSVTRKVKKSKEYVQIEEYLYDLNDESAPDLVDDEVSDRVQSRQGLSLLSDLANETFPDVDKKASNKSNSTKYRSFLQSNEMDTDDLFKSASFAPEEVYRNKSRSINVSRELDKESFPEISSSVLGESMRSSKNISGKTRNLHVSPNMNLRTPLRSNQKLMSKGLEKDALIRHSLNMVKLQSEELNQTKQRYRKFLENVGEIMKMMKASYENEQSKETMRKLYRKLEGEMQSFITDQQL